MRTLDLLLFSWRAIRRNLFRSVMLLLSMSIGVGSVIVLTGLGEGARQYVLGEFSALGKDLLILLPGRKETTGGIPPLLGEAPRDVTLEDSQFLLRLPEVSKVAPMIIGSTLISYGNRDREVVTIGTTRDFFSMRDLTLLLGKPLPDIALDLASSVCVIGPKLKQELFGNISALGEWVRVGDRRFRIIGVLEGKGESLGFDMSDMMIIPVASAQNLFNVSGLFRVFIEISPNVNVDKARSAILAIMEDRHEGEKDVTLISQDAMLGAFNDILTTLTMAVVGIAAISLVVSGVLIMNVSLITVSQRTKEIGLLKALGASGNEIRRIFLTEASMMTLLGALLGIILGELLLFIGRQAYDAIPFVAPIWVIAIALLVAVLTGLVFAWLPASRAAKLVPLEALLKK